LALGLEDTSTHSQCKYAMYCGARIHGVELTFVLWTKVKPRRCNLQ